MYEGIQITSESDDLCTILKIACSLTFYSVFDHSSMCLSGKTILHQNSPATELVLEWEKRKDKTTISRVF